MTSISIWRCSYSGRLLTNTARFHRNRVPVDWFGGQARVDFPCWSVAQKALAGLRDGDAALWDAYANHLLDLPQ